MPYSPDDLTPLLFPAPTGELGFHQGVIETWDPTTGENTVTMSGATLVNVPLLNSGNAGDLDTGAVVGMLRFLSSYFILGRITIPGDTAPGTGLHTVGKTATAGLTLTGSNTLVPGTSQTFTTTVPNATCIVTTCFDMAYLNTTADSQHVVGLLVVDGVVQARQALMRCMPMSRVTVGQVYPLTFATPGNHTILMQARCSAAAGPATIGSTAAWIGLLLDQ